MGTIKSAIKSVFNYAAQNAEDAFAGMWFKSMHPVEKVLTNAFGLAGGAFILNASNGFDVALGSLLIAATASDFRMAGRAQRLGQSPSP